MLGVMLDCSRNAVMKAEKVKQFADIIRKMGYDTLMLYTEETYEIKSQPLFGYMRGRYTKEELKDIDLYCKSIGIELIPCIQTLAHLGCMFRWQTYNDINDCDDILLVDDEKTYSLIEEMFKSVCECFSSKKIHIGMDEAFRVGLGKYREKHGFGDRFDIINRHLHKVCDISKKFGLEPMIWSDMFCSLAYDSKESDKEKIKEKASLPDNISLVYWDYYSDDFQHYCDKINLNKAFDREVIFAGGAWTWKGFAPDNTFSLKTTKPAIEACLKCGIDNVIMTVWGDDGSECSYFTILPTLMYTSLKLQGIEDMNIVKERFKEIVGCDFDDFMLLDKLDTPKGNHDNNPSKYLLYNDLFCGLNDYRCNGSENDYYKNLADRLKATSVTDEFSYIFDMYTKLADVLSLKADLGIKTRKAYNEKSIEALKEVSQEYSAVLNKLEAFHKSFEKCWFLENKPFGFDVQDMRLGGLMQRIKSCQNRLFKFINGEIQNIPELEEQLINEPCPMFWSKIITPNVTSHVM